MSRKFNYPNSSKRSWQGRRKKMKHNKFHAKKVRVDGCTFDSKAEYRYYLKLKTSDKVEHFTVHEPFEIVDPVDIYISGKKKHYRKRRYTPDFVIRDDSGQPIKVVDVKGKGVSDAAGLRMALFTAKWKLPVYIAKYDYKRGTFREYIKK